MVHALFGLDREMRGISTTGIINFNIFLLLSFELILFLFYVRLRLEWRGLILLLPLQTRR